MYHLCFTIRTDFSLKCIFLNPCDLSVLTQWSNGKKDELQSGWKQPVLVMVKESGGGAVASQEALAISAMSAWADRFQVAWITKDHWACVIPKIGETLFSLSQSTWCMTSSAGR